MTKHTDIIRLGTRSSKLALVQAHMVRDALIKIHDNLQVEIVTIKTSGDWKPEDGEKPLPSKELYTKEIEQALLNNDIDLAVHSMKDVETFMPEGLMIKHVLPREDARDCILYSNLLADNDQKIKGRICVGTVSVRRQAFLLNHYPHLQFQPLRGNVETRIMKTRNGQVDMTLLALAGLKRLGLDHEVDEILEIEDCLPAAGQGVIGIQIKEDNQTLSAALDPINCFSTYLCVIAERCVLEALDGSCHTPIGAYALWEDRKDSVMRLRGWHAHPDGSSINKKDQTQIIKTFSEAQDFGYEIGEMIKDLS